MNAGTRVRRRGFKHWLPVIAWAGVIFIFSTDIFSGSNTGGLMDSLLRKVFPALSGEVVDLLHLLARKLGHFVEFFIFAVLTMRALRNQSGETRAGLALALTALYAVSDELHQSLVPSRGASVIDVLIDVFGGLCGILWFHLRHAGKRTF